MIEPLPMPETVKGVLSFDFDGTLLDPNSDSGVAPAFYDAIRDLHEGGWLWGINTGRSQMQMVAGFVEGGFPFAPDFMIAREREIYTPGPLGRWIPVREWNERCEKDHKKLFKKAKRVFKTVKKHVETETNARWVEEEGDPAGVIASSSEEMCEIIEFIEEHRNGCENLAFQRNSIYMRFSHAAYHKGSALAEIVRRAGVDKSHTFVIGDAQNDMDMLNSEIAEMIACPANAIDSVKNHVIAEGGYVSPFKSSRGVLDALNHYFC